MDLLCENKRREKLVEFSIGCERRIIVNVKWDFKNIYISLKFYRIDNSFDLKLSINFIYLFFFRKRSLLKKRRLRNNSYNLYQCIPLFVGICET